MCQKVKQVWQCGHTETEDPRRCRTAQNRSRSSCQEYAFAWAYRDPVVERRDGECQHCQYARIELAKQHANQEFVQKSRAYPRLRDVSTHDDATRQISGRPRYNRCNTSSGIVIPKDWTSAQNRLPSNANEFEQFVRGRFNPLQNLPDSHIPPQLPGPIIYSGPRPLPPPDRFQAQNGWKSQFRPQQHAFTSTQPQTTSQGYKSRAPPPGYAVQVPHHIQIAQHNIARHERAQITPPDDEKAPVILEDMDYPYVEFRGIEDMSQHHGSGRRPSYTRNNDCKGWVPPIASPLPPRHETDTAPPSRAGSVEPAACRSLP